MEKRNYRTLVLLLFMVIIIAIRVVAPLSPDFKVIANFSGIGALAIFGGAYFRSYVSAFVLPILILFLSDLGLALTMGKDYVFYEGWFYTYIAFALMVLAGKLMINKPSVQHVIGASLVGVFIHWIVSDFGLWIGTSFYPHTLVGFWACLVAAIPFELKFLYGTLAYSAIMFAAFEGLKVKFPLLQLKRDTEIHS